MAGTRTPMSTAPTKVDPGCGPQHRRGAGRTAGTRVRRSALASGATRWSSASTCACHSTYRCQSSRTCRAATTSCGITLQSWKASRARPSRRGHRLPPPRRSPRQDQAQGRPPRCLILHQRTAACRPLGAVDTPCSLDVLGDSDRQTHLVPIQANLIVGLAGQSSAGSSRTHLATADRRPRQHLSRSRTLGATEMSTMSSHIGRREWSYSRSWTGRRSQSMRLRLVRWRRLVHQPLPGVRAVLTVRPARGLRPGDPSTCPSHRSAANDRRSGNVPGSHRIV
jgi:hypothetical protein